jgi:hypothetical protein
MLVKFDMLTGFGFFLSRKDFAARWNLFGAPKKIHDAMLALQADNAQKRVEYLAEMKTEQQMFAENLNNLASEVLRLERFDDPSKVVQVSERSESLVDCGDWAGGWLLEVCLCGGGDGVLPCRFLSRVHSAVLASLYACCRFVSSSRGREW